MFKAYEFWVVKKQHSQKMSTGERRILRHMSGNTFNEKQELKIYR